MVTKYGFELLQERRIQELNTLGRLYRHVKTGARLLSLENRDTNKVFSINFRTPPEDSTGLPHIMEHSVLCGSQKYPVKEPFVELMKGSLNTFLNAFTFPDKTCYPVASQNLQDFYNLIEVYMDAVLYPLITPQTLQQEGWHYELDSLDAPLTYKGVVFNEMKGAYSSPDSLMYKYVQQTLFPDHVYGLDSGGDPRHIPDLTYSQFKAFHERFYHPSNALIYFYGDDDPEARLQLMDQYLSAFEAIDPRSQIGLQPRLSQPRTFTFGFDSGEGEDSGGSKAMLTVNFLLETSRQAETSLGTLILAEILVGTPASPLRKALIDSGLGEDLAGVGLEADLQQQIFSTGLKGIKVEHAGRVEKLVLETLKTLAQQGIDPETIAAALNTVEFRLRENNSGNFPQGLVVMLRVLTTWLYDEDPFKQLAFEEPLEAIKTHLSAGQPYFENLVGAYFVDNPHRITILLKPESGLQAKQDEEERQRLANQKASLGTAALEQVMAETQALKQRQETPDSPESLAKIPVLELKDLDTENQKIPAELIQLDLGESGAQPLQFAPAVLYHDLFTNGILYLDLAFDLRSLPQDLLSYMRLFGRALLETGTHTEDFVRLSQRIGRTTGGIVPTSFAMTVTGQDQATAWLVLRGKATVSQAQGLCDILNDVLQTARLDNQERFRQIVLEEKAEQEAQLTPMGHSVVNRRLNSYFTDAGWAAEQMGGISYLFFLRKLIKKVDKKWPEVLADLEKIRQVLVNRQNMITNVTLDRENWYQVRPILSSFLYRLPDAVVSRPVWQRRRSRGFEGLTIPAKVNYVGKGARLYELGYALNGSVLVITNYLRATWLWERVRVHGGAYGGFCVFDPRSGVLNFLSYRDPNLVETVHNYDASAQFLRELDQDRLNEQELTKSIIGAIGDLDAYQLPDARGFTSLQRYLAGDTDAALQQLREQVLNTRLADFHAFGEVLELLNQVGQVVVLGSSEAIQAANVLRKEARAGEPAGFGLDEGLAAEAAEDWLQVQKVL